jgi:hypothetical protein
LECGSIVNKLYGSAVYEALVSAGNDTWINYEVSADILISAASATHEASIVVRFANSNNFYWMGLGCFAHKYSIAKMVNGAYTELASSGVIGDVSHNVVYSLKAVCEGSTLELWEGGVKVLTITDTDLTSGSIGLRTYNSSIEVSSMSAAVGSVGPGVTPEMAFFMLNRRK